MEIDRDIIRIHNAMDEDGLAYQYKSLFFPGGEPHVQVDEKYIKDQSIWVDARICTTSGFMMLLCVLDAIKGCNPKQLGLFLPYFPAARQDRRQQGTAFTLKIYADALRTIKLDFVLGFDPHSGQSRFYLSDEIKPSDVFKQSGINAGDYVAVICPDKGAIHRTEQFAKEIGIKDILYCEKNRDPGTGKLSNFVVPPLEKCGRYLMVDDIIDGGGTFIAEADEIAKNSNGRKYQIDLWASHSIFSKGIDKLLEKFDRIVTTDSFPFVIPSNDRIVVNKLFWSAARVMKEELV